jgi:hypothetical protein
MALIYSAEIASKGRQLPPNNLPPNLHTVRPALPQACVSVAERSEAVMETSREYRMLLADVAVFLKNKLYDLRLPDLTPEQIYYWLQAITLQDLKEALGKSDPVPSLRRTTI